MTPTLRTYHEGRIRRSLRLRRSLPDVFGWNLPFRRGDLDPTLLEWMDWSGILHPLPLGWLRSRLRIASLGGHLILHSPPSARPDTVFFGPDSYRFARFLEDNAAMLPEGARVVDLGAGAGAGTIALSTVRPDLRFVLADVNRHAVRMARINTTAAGLSVEVREGDGLANVDGPIDVVIANPPFLAGAIKGSYRHGGAGLGAAVTLDWMRQSAARLRPGGTILLYSASAIRDGQDALGQTLKREMAANGFAVRYRELDPDIFGGMLWRPTYRGIDRLAAVTMVATRLG